MNKILLVEDDKGIYEGLIQYLTSEGFIVEHAADLFQIQDIDLSSQELIILDWMLPDGQGIDLIKKLRKESKDVPIIMLTARCDTSDKVLGLEIGADDYLTKPFDPKELIARIRVQLRKKFGGTTEKPSLEQSGVSMDLKTREVLFEGRNIELNRMEFELLHFLLRHPNTVFTRQELLDKVWGMDSFPTTRTVDTHILNLRNKLSSQLIETIRGVGYRLK